jgi:hypothetical protein
MTFVLPRSDVDRDRIIGSVHAGLPGRAGMTADEIERIGEGGTEATIARRRVTTTP